MKRSGIIAHSVLTIILCGLISGLFYTDNIDFSLSLGIGSILFFFLIHIASILIISASERHNPHKKIMMTIITHSAKFLLSLGYVVVMLLVYAPNNFQMGVFLAILYLCYVFTEMIVFIIVSRANQ
ncbi:MAG: hypothetical protein PF481_08530 [Bacteroidales bacterium]|jgi:hypothetical protein|nr:hypothetical protein [Bacteroidales bacterium]